MGGGGEVFLEHNMSVGEVDQGRREGTYGVGCVSDVDSARRREASLMRLSRSLSFGTTCLVTSILSNSFYNHTSSSVSMFPEEAQTNKQTNKQTKRTSHFSPSLSTI